MFRVTAYQLPREIQHQVHRKSDDSLRNKLAKFYADRTLTNDPITRKNETFYLLLTRRLSKTCGQVISVDGGLHERFGRETYHNNVVSDHLGQDRARSPGALHVRRNRPTSVVSLRK